jgi:RNA polymerase-binding transcription factor DksA
MPADLASFSLHSITERTPAAQARYLHTSALPQWRTLLGLRWQEELEHVTELSLAYYGAEEDAADRSRDQAARTAARQDAAMIRRRTVAHRQVLAEIEAALTRVASGRFGWCEQCGTAIDAELLASAPERRYCAGCADVPLASQAG